MDNVAKVTKMNEEVVEILSDVQKKVLTIYGNGIAVEQKLKIELSEVEEVNEMTRDIISDAFPFINFEDEDNSEEDEEEDEEDEDDFEDEEDEEDFED